MHLVVDDQAPVTGVEDLEVRVDALTLGGHDLVGRDRDGPDLLARTRVLPDLISGERRALEQFIAPLASGHGVGHQNQRGCLGKHHRHSSDNGFARSTRKYDDTAATVPKALSRFRLVLTWLPFLGEQADRMTLAIDVAGHILRRPSEFDQCLLEVSALTGVNHDRGVINPRTQQ